MVLVFAAIVDVRALRHDKHPTRDGDRPVCPGGVQMKESLEATSSVCLGLPMACSAALNIKSGRSEMA